MYVIGYVKFMQTHPKVKDIISRTNVVTIFCSYKKKKKKRNLNKTNQYRSITEFSYTREKKKSMKPMNINKQTDGERTVIDLRK